MSPKQNALPAASPAAPKSSANPVTPLRPEDILNFANGKLDLVKGYEYNEEQVMNILSAESTLKQIDNGFSA